MTEVALVLILFGTVTRMTAHESHAVIDQFSSEEEIARAIQEPVRASPVRALLFKDNQRSKAPWKGLLLTTYIATEVEVCFPVLCWVENERVPESRRRPGSGPPRAGPNHVCNLACRNARSRWRVHSYGKRFREPAHFRGRN